MKVYTKGNRTAVVATYAAASAAVRAAWANGRGSTFYADRTAGLIENDAGEVVAHVSFNGKVWQGDKRLSSGNVEIDVRGAA